MKLGKDSALEKLRTSKDDLISALKKESATWDSFDDKEAIEILDIYEKNKYVFSNSVIDTLHTIKVNDAFDCNILKERKTSNGIIIIDSTELYIFQQIGDKLKVINFTVSIKDDYSDIQLFTFNLKQNEKIIDENSNSKPTSIIAIGGGSVIDACKALSVAFSKASISDLFYKGVGSEYH